MQKIFLFPNIIVVQVLFTHFHPPPSVIQIVGWQESATRLWSHIHTGMRQRTKQGEPNECLINALWKVDSLFAEASNKAVLKRMVNTFSLKYRLEMDSICCALTCSVDSQTQFALLLWHNHIYMLADARLTSFKSGCCLTIRAIYHTLFNIEGLSHTLLTHFEPLYMNMYHIGPLDGTVSRYTLRLKIYGATSILTTGR